MADEQNKNLDSHDALHAQAMEEIAAEKEGRKPADFLATLKKDAGKDVESDESSDKPAQDGDDGDADKGKDEKDADDKTDEDADDKDDKSEDGDKSEDKDEEDDEGKEKDGEEGESDDEDLDKKITAHAEKQKMTYAEAKEDIEKTDAILKQFKNDPAEMARALRSKDREYSKLKADADKAAAKKEPVFKRMTDDEYVVFARKCIPEDHPGMIAKYREMYPAKSESMSDEAVVEELALFSLNDYKHKADQKEGEIKESASKKRNELIHSIPEKDRRFIPEVKALLLETADVDVISDSFDIQDAIFWAKGKVFDKEIADAEARGAKRSKENPKILGSRSASSGSGKPSPKGGKTSLNDKQKAEAIRMYGNNNEDAECYRLFVETYEEELKKNPNFVY